MRLRVNTRNGLAAAALVALAALAAVPSIALATQSSSPDRESSTEATAAAAPPGPGEQLGTAQAMYPRAIRLEHSGAANGRVIASVSVSVGGGVTDSAAFFESADGGASFHQISVLSDPRAGGGPGTCCGSLFELPRALGDQPAGTLLFATTVGMPNKAGRSPEIRVWASTDQAYTWTYLSSCASAPGAPADRGLWEPELSLDARGVLHCYFSDDSRAVTGSHTGFDQTIADVVSTDGGRTWTSRRDVVAIASTSTTTYRPGMANVRRLPDGTYLMSYELCGSGLPDSCEVRVRTSGDGWNWGAATDPGTVVATPDGKHLFHAPTIAWAPGGGPHGRVLLIGGLLKNGNGTILRPVSGTIVLVNTLDGAGPWYQLDAPVTVGFSATPDEQELVCNNYSSSLLPSPDGAGLLEIATRRDSAGACRAYFGTAPALGTGDYADTTNGGTYRLVNGKSGQCLDVPDAATTATKLQQWTCNGWDPQNWRVTAKSGGYVTLTNEHSGLCLDVPSASKNTGVQLQQWRCNGTDAQLWKITKAGNGATIASKVSGLCMDVAGGSVAAGTAVQQWKCNGTAAQLWRAQRPLSVLPLGDSITDGLGGTGGYRADLYQMFRADDRYVDFVGSQFTGPDWLRDRHHEGHPGWRIDQLDAQVTGYLTSYRPDVVLLHIGTNDVLQDYALDKAPARLSTLLDHITAAAPGADVYVSTIVPFGDDTDEAQARTYNTQLASLVRGKAAAGRRLHLVDMHASLTVADLQADGVHPTNGGYSKMAARWYGGIYGATLARTEAEAAGTTLTDATIIETANASGDKKVGHIDNTGSVVELNVSVSVAGPYRMYVRAADGTGTPCGHTLTVNGAPAGELTYPGFGWDQWAIVAVTVPLDSGPNTIRFGHGSCYAELDSIDLAA